MEKEGKKETVLSFLGADVEIQGTILFLHNLRIDGSLNGDVISENGRLVVGRTAEVNGNIQAADVTVMGRVNGNITALERVDAFPPATISGDIKSPVIGLEKGVAITGKCTVIPGPPQLKK